MDVAKAQENLARAQVAQAEAELEEHRFRIGETKIVSPLNGVVGERHVDPGALVTSNTLVVLILDLSTMVTVVNVPERDINKIYVGNEARVTLDAAPGEELAGRVVRISPLLDAQTRTAPVEIELPNPNRSLKAEMFARVDLNLMSEHDALLIPRDALVYRGNRAGVFMIEEDLVRFQQIETGLTESDQIEVLSGLSEKDRHDIETANDLALSVKDVIEGVPGVTDAQISRREGMPEMLVRVDRQKAATMGLNVSDLADTLRTTVGGRVASMFREDGREYNIMVRLVEEDRRALSSVEQVPIYTPLGQTVPVASLVSMERREGPVRIERKDQERIVTVSANFADRDLQSVVGDIQSGLRQVTLPPEFSIVFGGEYEEQQEAFLGLLLCLVLAVLLVYMVMAAQFESYRDPLVILFSIPLASIGVILMLFLTNTTFSIQAFIGIIMLSGIVVNNAIVLVDYMNLLRRRDGMPLRQAVEVAGRRRLRPILMTTLTTVLAMTPMALGIGEGGEVQAPMARVVIGGLLASTLITLVLIPTLYTTVEEGSAEQEDEVRESSTGAEPASV